jgi:hypothetical protein
MVMRVFPGGMGPIAPRLPLLKSYSSLHSSFHYLAFADYYVLCQDPILNPQFI